MSREAIELSDLDDEVIRALQGTCRWCPSRTRRPRPSSDPPGRLLEHLESMRERKALRRVAAILFHRRAGFSANGMGVWKVPDERIMELARGWPPSAGSPTATSGPPTPTGPTRVFTMAHGRSKEECDAILDSIAEFSGIEERTHALLLDRVQEDPPPLLHGRAPGSGKRSTRAERARRRSAARSTSGRSA